jgi:hypothetical protein
MRRRAKYSLLRLICADRHVFRFRAVTMGMRLMLAVDAWPERFRSSADFPM